MESEEWRLESEKEGMSREWIVVGVRGRMSVQVRVMESVRVKQCAALFGSNEVVRCTSRRASSPPCMSCRMEGTLPMFLY